MSRKNTVQRKRYSLTLTQEKMEKWQHTLDRYNQPTGLTGVVFDAVLDGLVQAVEGMEKTYAETGRVPTIKDLLASLGESMDDLPI